MTKPPVGDVAAVFGSYGDLEPALLRLRELIFETAEATPGVGTLTETLKWGQPSYLTEASGSGSTIRVAPTSKSSSADYGMFFICNTTLVDSFRTMFGDLFSYEGNRAIEFCAGGDIATEELRACIAMALTYHQR